MARRALTAILVDQLTYWRVPRCWPGETVAILGGGQSLTKGQVDHCRGRCRVIAINRAFQLAPWADWLWACDAERFWKWYPEAVDFTGTMVVVRGTSISSDCRRQLVALSDLGVRVVQHSGAETATPQHTGASNDPGVVRGNNACFQILSVIAHTGAARAVLLGIDMHGPHWHEGYPTAQPDYANRVAPAFASLVKPLATAGVEVVNCSPGSQLRCFPTAQLEDVL